MKHALTVLSANLCSVICVCSAVVLAFNHINGWGWFLFAAWVTYKDTQEPL